MLEKELFAAVKRGDAEKVYELLLQGANVKAVDELERTPLHIAACQTVVWQSKHNIIDLLYNCGGNINAKDRLGNTPLHLAVEKNASIPFASLLKHPVLVNITNNLEETPLDLAERMKNWGFINKLLSHYAKINILRSGETILHRTADSQRDLSETERVQLLDMIIYYNRQPKSLYDIPNYQGLTPLHIAITNGYLTYATLLVNAGANINRGIELPGSQYHQLNPLAYLLTLMSQHNCRVIDQHIENIITYLCVQGSAWPPENVLQKSNPNIISLLHKHMKNPMHYLPSSSSTSFSSAASSSNSFSSSNVNTLTDCDSDQGFKYNHTK